MELAEAVAGCLAEAGIEVVFGIPGGMTLPLNRAIADHPDLRFVMARHETAVTHEAWGYAESSGRPAATLVVPGPGDMNALNGLKNALNDCNPVVHLAAEADPFARGGDTIHEAPASTYDRVVKRNVTLHRSAGAVAVVRSAIAEALEAPQGPVRVGIPSAYLERAVPETGTADEAAAAGPPAGPPEPAVAAAAELLAASERPVVIAGGGVRAADATAELRAVAEALDAPVVSTRKGKGVFPADHDLYAGVLTVAGSEALVETIAAADAALGVGTDFDGLTTQSWAYDVPERLVHVTMHPDDLGSGYEPAVGIVADAAETLGGLLGALGPMDADGAARAARVREAERAATADLRADDEPPISSVAALAALREALPREAIVAVDASGGGLWADATFDAYRPRDYLNQGSWATMGTGLPSAIGAKLANPDRDVVAVCGDGGLLMALHELHTAVEEAVGVVTLVLDNADYAIISDRGERRFGMDRFDWPRSPISFVGLAEALGVTAERAETPGAVADAVDAALGASAPRLIEVPTDPGEPQVGDRFHTF